MRRTMASALGKMPTPSVRRLISPLRRLRWEGHVGQHIGLGLVQEAGKLWQLRAELVGDLARLRACGLGISLGQRRWR